MTVGEDQLNRALGKFGFDLALASRREPGSRDGRDIREAPLFVMRVRKAEFDEAREGGIAHRLPPPGRGRLIGEVFQPGPSLSRYGRHTLPPASSPAYTP